MRPAMSDQRPEVGDRSDVKTNLTSVLLECQLIVLASHPLAAAFWMQTTGACDVGRPRRVVSGVCGRAWERSCAVAVYLCVQR
jgi:hypothetical protein